MYYRDQRPIRIFFTFNQPQVFHQYEVDGDEGYIEYKVVHEFLESVNKLLTSQACALLNLINKVWNENQSKLA